MLEIMEAAGIKSFQFLSETCKVSLLSSYVEYIERVWQFFPERYSRVCAASKSLSPSQIFGLDDQLSLEISVEITPYAPECQLLAGTADMGSFWFGCRD